MKTLREYINLLEGEVTPGLRAVGVSEPSEESKLPTVQISFQHNAENQPSKSVQVNAGGMYSGNADDLRDVLHDMGVPIPDEDDQPNDSGVWVTVEENGKRIGVIADDEKADELLDILRSAGLYKGDRNA